METIKKNRQLVSVDWLELFTHATDEKMKNGEETIVKGKYTLKLEGEGTSFFAFRYIVKYQKIQVATLLVKPRARFIHKRTALLKLSNRVLYSQEWAAMASDLVHELGLIYKGITRIDLCCDMKRFAGGRRVHKFIKDYVMKAYGEDGYIHRKGSNEFSCHGSKDKGGLSKINYIAFGTRNSDVRAYIYNKSKELRESAHEKPWIKEFWADNGLMEDEKNDVWRCEISIKAKGTNMLNFETGELFKLRPEYVDSQKNVERIFMAYANKYLSFSAQHGQKRAKDFDAIVLFDAFEEIPVRPKSITKRLDSGRMERIITKKLKEYEETYSDLSGQLLDAISKTIAFVNVLSWAKQQEFDKEIRDRVAEGRILHMKSYQNSKSYARVPQTL